MPDTDEQKLPISSYITVTSAGDRSIRPIDVLRSAEGSFHYELDRKLMGIRPLKITITG